MSTAELLLLRELFELTRTGGAETIVQRRARYDRADAGFVEAAGEPGARVQLGACGAGLVIAAMLALREAGDPLPAAGVCLSPWSDLTGTAATSIAPVTAAVSEQLAALPQLPLLLFGDCMGSLIAFEVTRELRRSAHIEVAALIVASYAPPDQPRGVRTYHDAPPAQLREPARRSGRGGARGPRRG